MALPALVGAGILARVLGYIFAFTLGQLVFKVMSAVGIGYIAYVGLDNLLDIVQDSIDSNMAGLPSTIFQTLQILNVTTATNLLISAYSARYTLFFLNKRLTFNPPAASGGGD